MPGGRPAPEAVEVVKEMGLGPALEMHESQPLTDQLLHQADLVLTMTRSHRHSIITQWPHDAERVHVLCMDQNDVSDPIGGPVEVYRRCAAQIKGELERRIAELDII
jgi:protein-tyrosine-phosphatase